MAKYSTDFVRFGNAKTKCCFYLVFFSLIRIFASKKRKSDEDGPSVQVYAPLAFNSRRTGY